MLISVLFFWAIAAAIAWGVSVQWKKRAVFWPLFLRDWWYRDEEPSRFYLYLGLQVGAAIICFIIPIGSLLNL